MCPCGTIDPLHPNSNPCPGKYKAPVPCKNFTDVFNPNQIGDYAVKSIKCVDPLSNKSDYYPKPAIVSFLFDKNPPKEKLHELLKEHMNDIIGDSLNPLSFSIKKNDESGKSIFTDKFKPQLKELLAFSNSFKI